MPSIVVTSPDKEPTKPVATTLEQLREAVSTYPICLVTGGAGYIGSHTVLELLTAGFAVVVVDNLCNSHLESLYRVHYIARIETYPMLEYSIDTGKRTKLSPLCSVADSFGKIVCVIHFAALKAVGESLSMPLDYYEVNVAGLLFVLKAMRAHAVNTFVFSSSAVVYGMGHGAGIAEDAVRTAGQGSGGGLLTNPYGRSKWMSEEIINDFCAAHPRFHATSLRYFNPTGAHASGLIGENPKGTPNNIVPVILQAYERRRSRVQVFGSSYDTSDGTGVRDYIHVSDLAKGHLAALRKAVTTEPPATQYNVYNLGTGRGYSVLEIIKAFSMAAGTEVPYSIGEARQGDLGTVTASPDKAATELDWTAEFDLQDMCRDVYNWASTNPGGY
ncbi:UDP-glucose 4-epimerase, partial [Coniella lustricola]